MEAAIFLQRDVFWIFAFLIRAFLWMTIISNLFEWKLIVKFKDIRSNKIQCEKQRNKSKRVKFWTLFPQVWVNIQFPVVWLKSFLIEQGKLLDQIKVQREMLIWNISKYKFQVNCKNLGANLKFRRHSTWYPGHTWKVFLLSYLGSIYQSQL